MVLKIVKNRLAGDACLCCDRRAVVDVPTAIAGFCLHIALYLPALFAAAVGVVAVAIKTKSMLWCCVSGIGLYIVLSLV